MMKAIGAFHLMALVVLTMNAGAQRPDTFSRSEPSDEEHQRKIQEHRSPWGLGVDDQRSPAGRDKQERLSQMRERGEQIRQRLADEYRQEQERIQRERREAGEQRQAEVRPSLERLRYGYGAYSIPARSYSFPAVTPSPAYYYRSSARGAAGSYDADTAAEEEDEGFAAASGKCGDVTTQKIGSFYYHSDGGVTQKIGNFFYGPDGQVTQKIGNFYYHSDGTTTQRIGNFYYDSDGGVTQKVGSFYYHSGGEPCEEKEE